jgi:ribosomal protein S18 acetylase RimI-like enzyme
MGADVELRQLNETDAPAYRELRLRALRDEPGAFASDYADALAQPLSITAERLREQAGGGDSFTLGAFRAADLVGMLTLLRERGAKLRHKASIVAVYVAPEARGLGVGRALIETAIGRARTIDGLEQLLLMVAVSNAAARRLYHSVGFVEYGIEPRAVRLGDEYMDDSLMVLRLFPAA